jgi:hypothetical protein
VCIDSYGSLLIVLVLVVYPDISVGKHCQRHPQK